jgi:ketosteroid isomerase-like protein
MSALPPEVQLAVQALLTAYCAAIDRRADAYEAAAYFADDGVLDNTALGSPLVQGRTALIEAIGGVFSTMAGLEHYLTNFMVTECSGDVVQAQAYVQAHGRPVAGEAFSMRGIYRLEGRRKGAAWQIERLTFQPFP